MTFQQYIDNPLGKKNSAFSQREMYRQLYTSKFDKLFLREAGKINYKLYIDSKRGRYIAHIKIPSETVKNFYYDAVIYFYTSDGVAASENDLKNYEVKFFSNDPAFVFTYMRVFLKNNMLFEDLKPKCSKLALSQNPTEKNPYEIPGYSKILYFAYLFMKNKGLFNKFNYTQYGAPYDKRTLLAAVEHTDIKIAKRQELGKEVRKVAKNKDDTTSDSGEASRTKLVTDKPNGNISITKFAKTIGKSKTTPYSKTVKTTKRK